MGRATCSKPPTRPGNDRFVFTSTTSLMISETIRAGKAGGARRAAWLDEEFGPLAPRNIYGVTKLAAERLCRRFHDEKGLAVAVLRTGRFFPEDDDTHRDLSGPNIKANEFLNRRLTVEDAAEAHVVALEKAPALGFETFILSAPPPFVAADCEQLIERRAGRDRALFSRSRRTSTRKAAGRSHVDRPDLRSGEGGAAARLPLPNRFRRVLGALERGGQLPFAHDPSYVSPKER